MVPSKFGGRTGPRSIDLVKNLGKKPSFVFSDVRLSLMCGCLVWTKNATKEVVQNRVFFSRSRRLCIQKHKKVAAINPCELGRCFALNIVSKLALVVLKKPRNVVIPAGSGPDLMVDLIVIDSC